MRVLTLMLLCLTFILLPPAVHAQVTIICEGRLPARLLPGEPGRVTAGAGNRVRSAPSTTANIIGVMPAGTTFQTILGPACVNGYTWWFISWNNTPGWTVESDSEDYWLEPVASPAVVETMPEEGWIFEYKYMGIEQFVPFETASAITPRFVEEQQGLPYGTEPAHIQITFEGYTGSKKRAAQMRVYRAADYARATGFDLAALQNAYNATPEAIPLVPELRTNAQRDIIAQRQILEFRNGYAARYIAAYSQAPILYSDGDPLYIFTGMTEDGQHVIVAQFPLNSVLLPSPDAAASILGELTFDSFIAIYQDYLSTVESMLDAAAPAWFSPSLTALDDLMQALIVTPNVRQSVQYAGVSFELFSALLPEPTAQTLTEVSDENTPDYLWHPAGVEFVFIPSSAFTSGASLHVYRAVDYERIYNVSLDPLRRTLAEHPETPDTTIEPRVNAARIITAQPTYIDFAGGAGVRYIAQWSQDIQYISPQMTYIFTGLTHDGEYFILGQIATGALALSEAPELLSYASLSFSELGGVYVEMIEKANGVVNALQPHDFSRPLDWLDRLMASLVVQPVFGP